MTFPKMKPLTIIIAIVMLVQVSITSSLPQSHTVYGDERVSENIPDLLITEIVAQSTTEDGSDAYEFVEIYNNTNQTVQLQDYLLRYHYPEPADDLIWPIEADLVIEPEETFVFWLGKDKNQHLTVDDFNNNFDVQLVEEEDIYKIDASALHNERHRAIVLETKSGHTIANAVYNDASYDVESNKGIFYKYPEDGSNKMVLIGSASEPATPGQVDTEQVPNEPNEIESDIDPEINDLTELTQNQLNEEIVINLESANDSIIKMLALYYKVDDGSYQEVSMKYNESSHIYEYIIDDLSEVLGSKQITYYYEATNGSYTVTSDPQTIDTTTPTNLKINVEDGEIVRGNTLITGTIEGGHYEDLSLSLNDSVVETYPTVGTKAHFKFHGSKMNKGYQNAVTLGEDTLFLMDEAPSGMLTVPITEGLVPGENTIAIRSGDYHKTYFEDDVPTGKLNTFIVTNFQLVLSDGTVIRDPEYGDSEEDFRIGDAATDVTPVMREFTFDIPDDKMDAIAYEWDTTEVEDGDYIIQVEDEAGDVVSRQVTVDNHGPDIESSIEEGKSYKGTFTIDVTAEDAQSNVKNLEVLLDDEAVEVPFETSSAQLSAGEHELKIYATDEAGNESEKTINFSVVEEQPSIPEVISPKDGQEDTSTSPTLEVQVSDPTVDDLDVNFYQGYIYNTLKQDHVKVYQGETDSTHIATRVPEGETELTKAQYEKIEKADGQLLNHDTNQFPYLRIEAAVDEDLMAHENLQLHWEGQSIPGRTMVMMAWNYVEEKWDTIVESEVLADESMQLTGEVQAEQYVEDNQITYLIQDQDETEVPTMQSLNAITADDDQYDYAFAWLTDTQFNVESDPRIFKEQLDWIVDHADENKIKYVFHTGDIVNRTFEEKQWELADDYMKILEENDMPYGVLAGNHDVGQGYILDFDYSYFYKYFGEDRFKDQPYYGGSYKNNRGHYDLISENGNDYIMVHMGWGDGDPNENWLEEDIEWMNDVLEAYPNRIAILSFHKYIHTQGMREPANADQIFEEVVVPNENVAMVLGGHYTESQMVVDEIDDNGDGTPDRKVYQILSNYQGTSEGGAGYMKLLEFDVANNKVHLKTYSPYRDDYDPDNDLPGDGEFELELDLTPNDKQVATDYIEIGLYTDEEIGTVHDVISGETATTTWEDLDHDTTYLWYATAEDEYGGFNKTSLQQFSTGPNEQKLDLTKLEALISEARAISNDDDVYTTDSFASLQEAIEVAEASLEAAETDEDVSEAIAALQLAIDNLVEKEESEDPKVDLTELKALISKARNLSNDDGVYTSDSFAALQEAIVAAEASLETIETDEDVSESIAALQLAIDDLVKKEIKENEDPPVSKDPKPTDGENELPKTATSMYSLIVLGLLLIVLGAVLIAFLFQRKWRNI